MKEFPGWREIQIDDFSRITDRYWHNKMIDGIVETLCKPNEFLDTMKMKKGVA